VNNVAPELPETLFDKAPTVDLFEPLAWIAIPSDTRIKVNPSSHFGDGSQIGDNREVTISISQADLEELSGQTLSVDFINTQDFLFRDDISLPVGIGDVGTPFEVAFGSWERSPDDANNTDRFVLNSDLTFTWLNGFVTDDGFFSNWNISGTLRVEEPVEGGWTMYYVGISDCNSGQPDFNNPCFTGRVDVLPGRRLTQETAFTPANPDLPGGLEVDRLGFDGFPGDGIKFYFRESK
jgi:hypothetical protein